MAATFNKIKVDHKEETETMKNVLKQLNKKIERLKQRFIEEELTQDLFKKYHRK